MQSDTNMPSFAEDHGDNDVNQQPHNDVNPHILGDSYKKSNVIARLFLQKIESHNLRLSIVSVFTRTTFILSNIFFIYTASLSANQISLYHKSLLCILMLIIGIMWIVERFFTIYANDRIEFVLIRSEMTEIGREYNPWSSSYAEARSEIEAFGWPTKFLLILKIEPFIWILISMLIIYLH